MVPGPLGALRVIGPGQGWGQGGTRGRGQEMEI